MFAPRGAWKTSSTTQCLAREAQANALIGRLQTRHPKRPTTVLWKVLLADGSGLGTYQAGAERRKC
jgi:hypothetical protein